MESDLDHDAGTIEHNLVSVAKYYRDYAENYPALARRFSLEAIDEAIEELRKARHSVADAKRPLLELVANHAHSA